jgi:hypothetical protein
VSVVRHYANGHVDVERLGRAGRRQVSSCAGGSGTLTA